jgi:hypothetical protein
MNAIFAERGIDPKDTDIRKQQLLHLPIEDFATQLSLSSTCYAYLPFFGLT